MLKVSIVVLFIKVVTLSCVLFYTQLITNNFNKTTAGEVFWIISTVTFVAVLSRLGLDRVLLRYLIDANSKADSKLIGRLIGTAFRKIGSYSLLLSFLAGGVIYVNNFPSLWWLVFAFVIVFFNFVVLFAEIVRAKGKIFLANILNNFLQSFLFSIILYVTLISEISGHYYIYVLFFISYFLVFIISVFAYKFSYTPGKIYLGSESDQDLLNSAKKVFGSIVASLIMERGIILLTGVFHDMSDVALLEVSYKFYFLFTFLIMAINNALANRFTADVFENKESISLLFRKVTLLIVLVSFPVMLITVYFVEDILNVFGREYVDIKNHVYILLASQCVNIITGPVSMVLLMSGEEKVLRNNSYITLVAFIVIGVPVIISYGFDGAVVVMSSVLVLGNLLSSISVYNKFRVLSFI